jgi:hypothetical protein
MSAPADPTVTVQVVVRVPIKLLDQIDRTAEAEGRTRSAQIRWWLLRAVRR